MDRSKADEIGALLYKAVKGYPEKPSAEEVSDFKETFDDKTLNQLIKKSDQARDDATAKLQKRSESFAEKVELGKMVVQSFKKSNYENSTNSAKDRRKRVKEFLAEKEGEKNQQFNDAEENPQTDSNDSSGDAVETDFQKKSKSLDIEAIAEDRRIELDSQLTEKITKKQDDALKEIPSRTSSPLPNDDTDTNASLNELLSESDDDSTDDLSSDSSNELLSSLDEDSDPSLNEDTLATISLPGDDLESLLTDEDELNEKLSTQLLSRETPSTEEDASIEDLLTAESSIDELLLDEKSSLDDKPARENSSKSSNEAEDTLLAKMNLDEDKNYQDIPHEDGFDDTVDPATLKTIPFFPTVDETIISDKQAKSLSEKSAAIIKRLPYKAISFNNASKTITTPTTNLPRPSEDLDSVPLKKDIEDVVPLAPSPNTSLPEDIPEVEKNLPPDETKPASDIEDLPPPKAVSGDEDRAQDEINLAEESLGELSAAEKIIEDTVEKPIENATLPATEVEADSLEELPFLEAQTTDLAGLESITQPPAQSSIISPLDMEATNSEMNDGHDTGAKTSFPAETEADGEFPREDAMSIAAADSGVEEDFGILAEKLDKTLDSKPSLDEKSSTLDKVSSDAASTLPKEISLAEANIDLSELDFETPTLSKNGESKPPSERAEEEIAENASAAPVASGAAPTNKGNEQTSTEEDVNSNISSFTKPRGTAVLEEQIDYDQAYRLIRRFKAENQITILKGIQQEDTITHTEANEIARRVIEGENEELIANFVRNLVFEKTYRESDISEESEEKKIRDTLYKQEKVVRLARNIFAAAVILLFGLFMYTYGINYTRSQILYQRAYTQINKQNRPLGEQLFTRGWTILPSVSAALRIGNLYYLDQRDLSAAEKKYLSGLSEDPTHKKTLLAYTSLLSSGRRFDEAISQIDLLKTTYSSQDRAIREADGEVHLAWGRFSPLKDNQDIRLNRGIFIYRELLEERGISPGKRNLYLSRSLEGYSLKDQYNEAKYLYSAIESRNPQFVEPRAFTTYMEFLIDTYETNFRTLMASTETSNFDGSRIALDQRLTEVVHLVNNIEAKLYLQSLGYLPFYHSAARWNLVTDETEHALAWTSDGIDLYELDGAPFEFEPALLYSLDGEIRYLLDDTGGARAALRDAISLYPQEPRANYYLGKILLTSENDLTGAQEYFTRARANLNFYARPLATNDALYRDMLYSLGYTHYAQYKQLSTNAGRNPVLTPNQTPINNNANALNNNANALNNNANALNNRSAQGLTNLTRQGSQVLGTQGSQNLSLSALQGNPSSTEEAAPQTAQTAQTSLENALAYWNELLSDPFLENRYILDYAIANSYLMLNQYSLAEAKLEQAIAQLREDYTFYQERNGRVGETTLERIEVLSDLYNNLGIAKAEQRRDRSTTNPYAFKQAALENFINAITIKDSLSLIRGSSYANFNTLNYETSDPRGFLITDDYVPTGLIR